MTDKETATPRPATKEDLLSAKNPRVVRTFGLAEAAATSEKLNRALERARENIALGGTNRAILAAAGRTAQLQMPDWFGAFQRTFAEMALQQFAATEKLSMAAVYSTEMSKTSLAIQRLHEQIFAPLKPLERTSLLRLVATLREHAQATANELTEDEREDFVPILDDVVAIEEAAAAQEPVPQQIDAATRFIIALTVILVLQGDNGRLAENVMHLLRYAEAVLAFLLRVAGA